MLKAFHNFHSKALNPTCLDPLIPLDEQKQKEKKEAQANIKGMFSRLMKKHNKPKKKKRGL